VVNRECRETVLQIRDSAAAWLQAEVSEGRLAQAMDSSALGQIAGVLRAGSTHTARRKKTAEARSNASAELEVRSVPATSAQI
jgi:hypothetical protein